MKEIFTQVRNTCPICNQSFGIFFMPHSDDDREKCKVYKLFQVVRSCIHGIKKPRSLVQLKTYWGVCGFIADNTEHKRWNTKDKVDFQCRVATHFVDPDLVVVKPNGEVAFHYRSIAFKNLSHIEACNYFQMAYDALADFWNTYHNLKGKERVCGEDIVNMTIEYIKNK